MYCLRKPRSFAVSTSLLAIFYNAVVCSAHTFGVVCWGGNISRHERGIKIRDFIVKKGGEVIGTGGQSIEEVYFRRVRCRLVTILNASKHPLYSDFDSSRVEGSGRLRVPHARTNQLKLSFVP